MTGLSCCPAPCPALSCRAGQGETFFQQGRAGQGGQDKTGQQGRATGQGRAKKSAL